MPNWATNECTIVGDERDLKSLYETIQGLENLSESRVDYVFCRLHLGRVRVNSALLSVCTTVENDFGKEWLGNLVDVGKEITNDEELKSFEEELQAKNIDNYCYIEEIRVI